MLGALLRPDVPGNDSWEVMGVLVNGGLPSSSSEGYGSKVMAGASGGLEASALLFLAGVAGVCPGVIWTNAVSQAGLFFRSSCLLFSADSCLPDPDG